MILSTQSYATDEPEDSAKSQYISKKDIRLIGISLVVIGLVLYPVFLRLREEANRHLCQQNFSQIFHAIGLYAEENDQKLPPAFAKSAPDEPILDAKGRPFTWGSLISRFMNARSSLVCPTASADEAVASQHPETSEKDVKMTYGFFGPLGGYPIYRVSDPESAIIVAETSNAGSQESYDPKPLASTTGKTPDGFLIGYDDSNSEPSSKTRSVSRLAFRGSSKGVFEKPAHGRHEQGVFVLSLLGTVRYLKPEEALIKRQKNGELRGLWAPPTPE